MNKRELMAAMARHGDTGGSLAEYLGMARSTFSQKINENGTQFNQGEITMIKNRYNLSPEEIDAIFFAEVVSK